MRYRIIKKDRHGTVYDVEKYSEAELVVHLQSTFENTDHTIVAIINLSSAAHEEGKNG